MLDKTLEEKLRKIKILAMDVDGTMTDGAMYYSEKGEEMKRFSTRDGMGLKLLRKGGIQAMIITSEASPIVAARAEKLEIEHVILGSRNKSGDIREFCKKNDYELSEICYIGDDVNDEYVMKICGFSACPNDAVEIIKNTVDYVCSRNGGNGAVRELCEMILLSQNKAINLTENW